MNLGNVQNLHVKKTQSILYQTFVLMTSLVKQETPEMRIGRQGLSQKVVEENLMNHLIQHVRIDADVVQLAVSGNVVVNHSGNDVKTWVADHDDLAHDLYLGLFHCVYLFHVPSHCVYLFHVLAHYVVLHVHYV